MANKTNNDFQTENSELREKLNTLGLNFKTLSDDHKKLQLELIAAEEKKMCKNCEKNLTNVKNLKKHRSDKDSCKGVFKCDMCEKEFNKEWMMNAHKNNHRIHKCDRCDSI